MNNKKNSILSLFEWSLPAQSEPNRITAMAIRGAPHFSQKIHSFRKIFRSRAPAWECLPIRFTRALTRPGDQQPQSYCAKHRAQDRARFLTARKTRKRPLIASARQLWIEQNSLTGNGGQGQ